MNGIELIPRRVVVRVTVGMGVVLSSVFGLGFLTGWAVFS